MNKPPSSWSQLTTVAAPSLLCLGLLASLQRNGIERLQTLPMIVIGAGLTMAACIQWSCYRHRILKALQHGR